MTSTHPQKSLSLVRDPKVMWEHNWSNRYAVQLKRRVREILLLPVAKKYFDHSGLEKFDLGTKRTLEQWK